MIALAIYYAVVALGMGVVLSKVNNRNPPGERAPMRKVYAVAVFWLPCGLAVPWILILIEHWKRDGN